MRRRRRSGFSLLEVLIASGMLLGSVVVLGSLLAIGRRHTETAEGLTHAQRLCQNRLAEIVAGIHPLESTTDEPFAEDPAWLCTTTVDRRDEMRLAVVRVSVGQDPALTSRPIRFELVRWLRAPAEASPPGSSDASQLRAPTGDAAPGAPP